MCCSLITTEILEKERPRVYIIYKCTHAIDIACVHKCMYYDYL